MQIVTTCPQLITTTPISGQIRGSPSSLALMWIPLLVIILTAHMTGEKKDILINFGAHCKHELLIIHSLQYKLVTIEQYRFRLKQGK